MERRWDLMWDRRWDLLWDLPMGLRSTEVCDIYETMGKFDEDVR